MKCFNCKKHITEKERVIPDGLFDDYCKDCVDNHFIDLRARCWNCGKITALQNLTPHSYNEGYDIDNYQCSDLNCI